ncbi:MAG: ATP-binding protein [Myxococcota bacterium]
MTSKSKHIPGRILDPGTLLVLIAVAATLIVGICSLNSLERIGRVFPGFFVWENLFVPAVGEPHWTGVASGVRYQSWLVEMDGKPLRDGREMAQRIPGRSAGTPVEYGLVKDGQRYTVVAPLMVLGLRTWLGVLGIYVLAALALLVLGIVVLYMKPRDPAAIALFFFCVNLGLYMATAADSFGPYLFRVPCFYFFPLIPATAFAVISFFPVARERRPWETSVLAGLVLAGLALGTATNFAFDERHDLLVPLDRLTHVFVAASALTSIVFFVWYFFRAPNRVVRQRTKAVMLGTIGSFLPSIGLLAMFAGDVTLPLNFAAIFLPLFPLSIAYAIGRHDLFDIDRVIKRTLVYGALTVIVLGSYTLSISYLDYLFENLTEAESRLAQGVLIVGLILLTTPSRERIQDLVDRLYDRQRYSYRDVVRTASREFATLLDFEKLTARTLLLIDETLQPCFVQLYTVSARGEALLRGHLDPTDGTAPLRDPRGHSIAIVLRALARIDLVTAEDDAERVSAARAAAACALRELGVSLATAMRLEGRLIGVMLVGPKRAGGDHTANDVELLRTISDQLAVALENAQAYQTIDLLNRNLELKNIELEGTNRELRETQRELVQKERLAAIGELSGAVAHAIRNPLAGIKAAAQLALLELESHPASTSVSDVVSETDRLDARIGALLDFSKPFRPEVRPIRLSEVTNRAARDTRAKAQAGDVSIVIEGSESLPEVLVDPTLLTQATMELLSNAIDASPSGGKVLLRTGGGEEDGAPVVWIEVQDSGPGIAPGRADRIFDLFYTTKSQGTGFGLVSVRKITEGHGGHVVMGNGELGGACFRVVLPVRRVRGASA